MAAVGSAFALVGVPGLVYSTGNAILLFMFAAHLVDGFQVDGFLSAFFGALIVGMITLFLSGIWSARVTRRRSRRHSRRKPDDVIDI